MWSNAEPYAAAAAKASAEASAAATEDWSEEVDTDKLECAEPEVPKRCPVCLFSNRQPESDRFSKLISMQFLLYFTLALKLIYKCTCGKLFHKLSLSFIIIKTYFYVIVLLLKPPMIFLTFLLFSYSRIFLLFLLDDGRIRFRTNNDGFIPFVYFFIKFRQKSLAE